MKRPSSVSADAEIGRFYRQRSATMALPITLFVAFTVLATVGLFLLLRHHYGLRPAFTWSLVLLLAFAALGWWLAALVAGSGLG